MKIKWEEVWKASNSYSYYYLYCSWGAPLGEVSLSSLDKRGYRKSIFLFYEVMMSEGEVIDVRVIWGNEKRSQALSIFLLTPSRATGMNADLAAPYSLGGYPHGCVHLEYVACVQPQFCFKRETVGHRVYFQEDGDKVMPSCERNVKEHRLLFKHRPKGRICI